MSLLFWQSARFLYLIVFAILPLWYIPNLAISFGFTKTILVVVLVYGAVILSALAMLRSGRLSIYTPLTLIFLWLFVLTSFISAYLSGDFFDSVFGSSLEVPTVSFTVLFAFLVSLCLLLVNAKLTMMRLLLLSLVSLCGVYAYTISSFVMGGNLLNLPSQTIVGGFNDLAIYAGLFLSVILAVVHRVSSSWWVRAGATLITLVSLLILAVVNFSFLWIFIGFVSLMAFLYLIAKDTWLRGDVEFGQDKQSSSFALGLTAFICVISGVFIVSGDYVGAKMSNLTGLNYVEVRPSLGATTEIAKVVYQESIFTGVGPNRFADAWRQHKDRAINQTQFWNTTFPSGNSYIFSTIISTGLLGSILLLGFIITYAILVYRLVFISALADPSWRPLILVTTAASVYLWIVVALYSPGPVIMCLLALFTGLTIAISQSQDKSLAVRTINITANRKNGLLLVAATLLVIVFSTLAFIAVTTLFFNQAKLISVANSFAATNNQADYDQALLRLAESVPGEDFYPAERARLRLAELNRLMVITEPTADDQKRYQVSLGEGISLAEAAISADRTSPFNYAMLGSFYGFISPDQVEDVANRRRDAFALAKQLDPTNPEYALIEAQIENRQGNMTEARNQLATAIALKPDYTEALFLSSQLDIREGKATSAIATTRAIISLEPNNPGRYFQLGLLQLAITDLESAVVSLQNALMLDPYYANARYMLALSYLDLGLAEEALRELRIVQETNPDNAGLRSLISQVEGGDLSSPPLNEIIPVSGTESSAQLESAATQSDVSDTSLVSPVNRLPYSEEAEVEPAVTEEITEPSVTDNQVEGE